MGVAHFHMHPHGHTADLDRLEMTDSSQIPACCAMAPPCGQLLET